MNWTVTSPSNSAERNTAGGALNHAASRALLGAIRLYQLTLSGFIGGQCRFYPTCSHYAAEAVRRHGPLKGSGLAIRRIGRCHPFHPGGVDEVPKA